MTLADVPGATILEFERGYVPMDEPPGFEETWYKLWREAGGKTDAERLATPGETPPVEEVHAPDRDTLAARRLRSGGGPAFPLPSGGGHSIHARDAGASMRDLFALGAMVALLPLVPYTEIGARAYMVADDMLKAREGRS